MDDSRPERSSAESSRRARWPLVLAGIALLVGAALIIHWDDFGAPSQHVRYKQAVSHGLETLPQRLVLKPADRIEISVEQQVSDEQLRAFRERVDADDSGFARVQVERFELLDASALSAAALSAHLIWLSPPSILLTGSTCHLAELAHALAELPHASFVSIRGARIRNVDQPYSDALLGALRDSASLPKRTQGGPLSLSLEHCEVTAIDLIVLITALRPELIRLENCTVLAPNRGGPAVPLSQPERSALVTRFIHDVEKPRGALIERTDMQGLPAELRAWLSAIPTERWWEAAQE